MTVLHLCRFTLWISYESVLCGAALVMPILILVMTSMVAGSTVTDPQTGAVTTMEAFTSTWQIIGASGGMMAMDMTAMCNINLIFFMAGVYVCLFIAEDFRSGYAKNLFAVRSKKRVSTRFSISAIPSITTGKA